MITQPKSRSRAAIALPLAATVVAIAASLVNTLISLTAVSLGAPATGGLQVAS